MFCPNCGESDQKKETYCRKCGIYLAEFGKTKRTERSVEENFKVSTFFTVLTGIVSFVLSIWLYVEFWGKDDRPSVVLLAAGLLFAISLWQLNIFIRTFQLKKQFKKRNSLDKSELTETNENLHIESKLTNELLPEADFTNDVPVSVTENTTRKLEENVLSKEQN